MTRGPRIQEGVQDEQLLAAWRAGDRDAGDQLLRRHFGALFRFFDARVGMDAEDLVQRTLLDCLESPTALHTASFRGYLFGVARHRLIDHLRLRMRTPVSLDSEVHSVADLGTSPSQHVARDQEQRRLHDALRRISIDHQIVLELTYWEGLSGREIADVLEIDANTVRSRTARARAALGTRLVELGANPAELDDALAQRRDPE